MMQEILKNNLQVVNPADKLVGVLLINVGSPSAPTAPALFRYLGQFLSDRRILEIPAFFRLLLLYLIILPLRSFKSAKLYQKIWTAEGSPLIVNTEILVDKVTKKLDARYFVEMAMCCGSPSVESAVQKLIAANVRRIVVFPLYPQYASATTGGALEKAGKIINSLQDIPAVTTVPEFYAQPLFIEAFSQVIKKDIAVFSPDYILFSYHGLPEKYRNYQQQCYETTKLIADSLNLSEQTYTTSFQSRFGKAAWLKPYTEEVFEQLAQKGVRRLAVVCPSFVIDCLETLEEIGVRGEEYWLSLGGEEFKLISSLNSHPVWVDFIAERITNYGQV